jgi:hypothetical protein
VSQILPYAATPVRRSPSRPALNSPSRMLDDASAEEVFKLADLLAEDLEKIRGVINTVVLSTFEEPARNRRRARTQILEVWRDMAVAARILAQPVPRFRHGASNPVPRPRHRDPEVRDFVPATVPAALMAEVGR